MKRTRWIVLAFVLILAAAGPATAQELVVNGGFEAPVVAASPWWDIFDSGSNELGWTVEWAEAYDGAPPPAKLELHRGVNGWDSLEGSQHAELDTDWQGPGGGSGEQASVRIYQDLVTCPGGEYTLTYAWSPRPGHGDNIMKVYWNGGLVTTHSGSGGSNTSWTTESVSVTSASTLTRLEFVETGTPDSLGMFLDAVSVPEIECSCETDLVAGGGGDGGTHVGSVITTDHFDNTWTVTYNTVEGWELMELHLHLACDQADLPQNKNHNPKIGHFAYTAYPEPGTTSFVFPDDVEDLDVVVPLVPIGKRGFDECSAACPYFAAHAVVSNTASCKEFNTFYGAEQGSGDLYALDPLAGTATLIADINGGSYGNQNYPNGVGWDPVNERLYFTSGSGGLYFWNDTLGVVTTAGSLSTSAIADGTFFDGKYYYIPNNTDDLYEVMFNLDGTVASQTAICPDFAGVNLGFGDIVMDPAGPTLYVSAGVNNNGVLYSVDIESCAATSMAQPKWLQLAFGPDGVLYGQDTLSGVFYVVDPTTGTWNSVGTISTGDNSVFRSTDLASGTRCVPPTETAWGQGEDFGGSSWAMYFNCGACGF